MSEITATFRITIISLMIVSGAINTIAYKFQNKQMVFEGQFYKYFFHPYMQATTMFFGEALAFAVFIFMSKRDPETFNMRRMEAKSKGKEIEFNKFWLAIPAISDLVTSTLQYVALNFVAGSVYQMMRGGAIVTTFLFSIVFLKMKAQKNQVAGSALALIGVFIVGASSLIFSKSSGSGSDMQVVGYILLIASLFTNGFQFVFEEKLLGKYHIEPLEMVGYEGMFGLAAQLILVLIMSFVPCSFGSDACVFNSAGMPFVERPEAYFSAMGYNGLLLFFCILGVFSIATFNVTGVTVTKYINALARSICDVTRTVLVWIVGILVTVSAGANKPNYKWELIDGGAISIQLLGFLVLIAGNLVYNRIIKIPFLEPKEAVSTIQYI